MSTVSDIISLSQVAGDWFLVSKRYDSPNPERWFIERVVLWARVERDNEVPHVRAIDSTGLPHEDDGGDSYFVLGRDKSPTGQTWLELYDQTLPSRSLVREITEAMGNVG